MNSCTNFKVLVICAAILVAMAAKACAGLFITLNLACIHRCRRCNARKITDHTSDYVMPPSRDPMRTDRINFCLGESIHLIELLAIQAEFLRDR
jgi:hypothetical protein